MLLRTLSVSYFMTKNVFNRCSVLFVLYLRLILSFISLKVFAFVGCYAAFVGKVLLLFRTAYQSHIRRSIIPFPGLLGVDRTHRLSQKSVNFYQNTLCQNTDDRRLHLPLRGRLISRELGRLSSKNFIRFRYRT